MFAVVNVVASVVPLVICVALTCTNAGVAAPAVRIDTRPNTATATVSATANDAVHNDRRRPRLGNCIEDIPLPPHPTIASHVSRG